MANKKPTYTLATASLLKPLTPAKPHDRSVWSIPLGAVWQPYFNAMKVAGEVDMSDETLGAPLRLATESDGTPRFNKKGEPVVRVAKELNDQVKVVRESFVATLVADTNLVRTGDPKAFAAQVERALQAGAACLNADARKVEQHLAALDAVRAAMATIQDSNTHQPERELVAA